MLKAPIPWNDEERLNELFRLNILDTTAEKAFDDLTILASEICKTPISLVSLIDRDRQWIKSRVGIDLVESPRDVSFCGHVINEDTLFEIPDTHQDDRFKDNPFCVGESAIRYYAGFPLITSNGHKIGSFCVIDTVPSKLTDWQKLVLEKLAKQTILLIEANMRVQLLKDYMIEKEKLEKALDQEKRLLTHQSKLASLGQLAAGVAHEINNPVAIIKGYMSILEQELKASEFSHPSAYQMIKNVNIASDRIATIVKGLRTFTRSDKEQLVSFSLKEVLLESVSLLSEMFQREGVSLEVQIEDNKSFNLIGNRGRMAQVIVNLLANAKDASVGMNDREIKVALALASKSARLTVTDTGKGIPEEIREKIFDPFFTTKDVNQGTGIGLSIVNSIVKEHEGKINFETTIGKGSTFIVEIPLES